MTSSPEPLEPKPTAASDHPADALAGLYLHVPFCSAICPYCDFAVRKDSADQHGAFVTALELEIRRAAEEWRSLGQGLPAAERFDTVYWGGGTPSLLSAVELETLFETLRLALPIVPTPRIYFEANPEDVDPPRLALWRRLGVTSLSLGVQAFDAEDLSFLGRRHTAEQAESAIRSALDAGFETVSVDLIYGLPHHRADPWRRTLDRVVALEPHHLSCYELEIHPRTVFGRRRQRGELVPMDEPRQARLFELTHRHLGASGYAGYEVSNFAREPRFHSQHNRKYWHHVPYLGLGPSAHSYAGDRRWWNERSLPRWRRKLEAGDSPVAEAERLRPDELALEALMLGLRTAVGPDLEQIERRFGVELRAPNAPLLDDLARRGLARLEGSRVVPTVAGLAVADGLAARFEIVPTSPDPIAPKRGSKENLVDRRSVVETGASGSSSEGKARNQP